MNLHSMQIVNLTIAFNNDAKCYIFKMIYIIINKNMCVSVCVIKENDVT